MMPPKYFAITLESDSLLLVNRPLSALFSNLEHVSILAHNSFGSRPRFPVFLPSDPSQDPAQNRETRPLSMPDRKFSQEKVGGYSTEHLATQEWVRETSDPTNRPLLP